MEDLIVCKGVVAEHRCWHRLVVLYGLRGVGHVHLILRLSLLLKSDLNFKVVVYFLQNVLLSLQAL